MDELKTSQSNSSYLLMGILLFLASGFFLLGVAIHYLFFGEGPSPEVTTAALHLPPVTTPAPTNLDQTIEVTEGDTLADIFERYHLDPQDLSAVLSLPKAKRTFRHMKPGNQIQLLSAPNGALEKLSYQIDSNQFLHVARTKKGFTLKTVMEKLDTRRAVAQGVVRSSFYSAAHNAGLPTSFIWDLSKIFAWKINFKQGLHPGDTFEVLYEKKYFGDKFIEYGDILAAKFYVNGELYEAVRFKQPQEGVHYYTPTGESLDRAFVRTPLQYSRVSSSFNLARKHPILGITRPHEGVDLAASRGTAVKAPGRGVIAFEGRKGGYGNLVIINHGGGVTTRYGHLSRFSKEFHVGSTVKMGDVVAYVGSTGLATAPHLHYEYRINGIPKNPLSVKLPGAPPLAAKYRHLFLSQSKVYLAQMDKAVLMPQQITEIG